jgi:hypothetical protein
MFNQTEIITNGSDLVGWIQSNSRTTLSDYLTNSTSGLYVNSLPGVDFDMIEESLGDDWENVNDYLESVHRTELLNLMHSFMSRIKSNLGSRDILNNFDVSNGVADYDDLTNKNARFCGLLFRPSSSNNIKTVIGKIGLQLSESETVRLFLYETSQQSAIATFDFEYSNPLSLQWKEVSDFIINYRGSYGTNQQYLLGYYEHDPNNDQTYQLKGQAVEYEFDCGCSNSPKRYFGKYVNIQPIVIENPYLNYSGGEYKLPNMNDITAYYTNTGRGIFAKINVTCDITDVIVDNIQTFAKAYQLQIAIRVLEDYLASKELNYITDARDNRDFVMKKINVYYNMLNGWNDASGYRHRGIMSDLSIDFSAIDNICLPCAEDRPRTGYISYRG